VGLAREPDRPRGVVDYHRVMAQYQKLAEERIVTREELERGYFERDGLVIRKRRYELIRELPDGRYLVRAPQPPDNPQQPEQ
jgi:hypothetical protein